MSCATKSSDAQPPQQAQLARAVAAPDRSAPPEPLPGPALALLKERMASHARDMGDLVVSIMVLDYAKIQERAKAISSDVNLARPITDDATELSSAIPESFFVLQDELRARAAALGTAAAEQNAYHVADAYGRLSETCVRCHATFRPAKP